LAAGYITPYSNDEVRQQVIIVITDGWNIMCFNHKLKLQWESSVYDSIPAHMHHSEVAAVIGPQPIKVGDKGFVIVGARLNSEKEEEEKGHDHSKPIKDDEAMENLNEKEESIDHSSKHFSYYAFDGRTGALRWQHEEGDYAATNSHSDDEDGIPDHSYKLHVLSSKMTHTGEADWRVFKEDIMEQLPHFWKSRDDTLLEVKRFEKERKSGGGNAATHTWSSEDVGIPSSHVRGLPFGGMAPHSAADHIVKPNVVVAHLSDGIEVVHLYTGRPLCRIVLKDGLYADINGDGIIDHLQTITSHAEVGRRKTRTQAGCYGIAITGIPPMEALFNGSICVQPPGMFSSLFNTIASLETDYLTQYEMIEAANPIVMESFESSTLLTPHSEHELDTIFLVSTGRMTSFRPFGRMNWQIDTEATWGKNMVSARISGLIKRRRGKIQNEPSVPIIPYLTTLFVEPFGEEKNILAVASSIVIVDGRGNNLASTMIEHTSITTPVIGDFDNDGLNDIIIVTPNAYYGYSITRTSGSMLFSGLVLLLMLAMASLYVYSLSTYEFQQKRAMD